MAESAPSDSQNIEVAERPANGEGWADMVARQRGETDKPGSAGRELLRSLPLEQQQDKDKGPGRSELYQSREGEMVAEVLPITYLDTLRDASQRAGQEQDRGIDR
jgi:hypothetical protein